MDDVFVHNAGFVWRNTERYDMTIANERFVRLFVTCFVLLNISLFGSASGKDGGSAAFGVWAASTLYHLLFIEWITFNDMIEIVATTYVVSVSLMARETFNQYGLMWSLFVMYGVLAAEALPYVAPTPQMMHGGRRPR